MKKTLSLILALSIILSTFAPAFAVSEKSLYEKSGQILESEGVLEGSESKGLMLNENLKRQDMVVLMSRLYKEENIAKAYKGKHKFTDIRNSFYNPYVAWAVNKDLIHGMTPSRFGFGEEVIVQQFQTVLLRVLGYNEEAQDKNWDKVPQLAEKYKLMENLNVKPKEKLSRGQMAAMTVNALKQNMKNSNKTLAEYLNIKLPEEFHVEEKITVNKNTVKFEGKTNVKSLKLDLKAPSNVKLDKSQYDLSLNSKGEFSIEIPNFKAGKYEYKFISGNMNTQTKSFNIKNLPFELMEIRADNLKEIKLVFSNPVEKSSALNSANYSTNAGKIKSIRLEEDNTVIVLSLNETMVNRRDYKISLNKIKSQLGEEVNLKNEKFEAFDNNPPEVKEVRALGNKILKVYLTEPVTSAHASNFKIDNKRYSGKVEMEDNIITLTPYTSMKEGYYTLSVSGLEDYARFKGLDQNIEFEIYKDNYSPRIVGGSATTERVILEFDKEIDPSSVSKNNFYFTSGSRKIYPDSAKAQGKEVILNFSRNYLSTYETSIYVDGISDYWGNKVRNEEIKVKAEIDRDKPEVVDIKIGQYGKSLTVYYNKNVDGKNKNSYTIRDKNNKQVYIRNIEGSGNEYTLVLSTPLPKGANTIEIKDIYDTTSLKNKMDKFTKQIDVDDMEKPTITAYTGKDNEFVISFSKEMDTRTVEDTENYILNISGRKEYMPRDTEFLPIDRDNKSFKIILPRKINGKTIEIGKYGNLKEIDISSIRGINNIPIDPQTLRFDDKNQGEAKILQAVLVEPDLIEVKYNQAIDYAHYDDFKIEDRIIHDVEAKGDNIIHIYLRDREEITTSGRLTVVSRNRIETVLGTYAKAETVNVIDKVGPKIKADRDELKVYNGTIEIPFTEKLDREYEKLFKDDIIVESLNNGLLNRNQYSAELDRNGNTILLKINNYSSRDEYIIRLADRPIAIRDLNGNIVETDGWEYYVYNRYR